MNIHEGKGTLLVSSFDVLYSFKSFTVYFYLPYFVIINNLRYVFAYNIVGVTLTKFS